MRIDYNQNERIEFIEFLFGPWPEKCEVTIYDINPFAIEDKELIQLLSFKGNEKVDQSEAPWCFIFPDISVGIWREADPNEIDKNWIDEELKKAKYFWTIGIGHENYCQQ